MTAWLAPPLLPALVCMALLALVPRRLWYLQLPAVLGWAAVWVDNRLTGSWLDVAGLTVAVAGTGVLAARLLTARHAARPEPED